MKRSDNIEDIYPLSPLQQGMLFHTLYDPESEVYFEQLSYALRGALDKEALRRAWQGVIDRHTILRTAFFWERREKPLQVVRRKITLPWQQQDWRGQSLPEQQERLKAFLGADRSLGFDFSKAPLMRLALIQMTEDTHCLVWSHHHILLDGWSVTLVMKEVFALYEAFSRGREIKLQRSHPYQNYIAWLLKQDMSKAESFWRQTLKGFRAPTPLAIDSPRARPRDEKERSDEQGMSMSAQWTERLKAIANRHRLTLNTFVQGAWALLLSCYSGEQDVLFGSVVSGRPAALEGVETTVGLFINTLPVRVQISPEASVLSWLKQLQEQQIELREYEYSPLIDIHGWSEVPRGVPLFESIIVFENYPVAASSQKETGELEVGVLDQFKKTSDPLTCVATCDDGLSLEIVYDCHRFSARAVRRMLKHLRNLLEAIAADPEQRLCDLSVLTTSEQRLMLVEWQGAQADYPADKCIHELFEEQAKRTPSAVAVIFEERSLTYAHLNERANQLARHLQSLGAGPESLVAICMDRSLDMVVAILGVVKAGAAYLPIDPAYPKERIAFMIGDAGASAIITRRELAHTLPQTEAKAICLDSDWPAACEHDRTNPDSGATAGNPAYVIYTSGSTGKPKGVIVTHHNVVRLFESTRAQYGFNKQDVWTLFHSYAFDFSVWELWGALIYGGRLVVVPYLVSRSPKDFYELLGEQQVTILNQTPSAFRQLIQAEESAEVSESPALRAVIFGGEALDMQSLKPWVERHGDQMPQLINMYGITETTVHVTYGRVIERDIARACSLIGGPIEDLQLYIVDSRMQLVPVGVPGEMYVGGGGVARGYLNRADLTAERFVPNPFGNKEGDRLYKTGDLARYDENGDIECLGRVDHQVKIRGFRIELGEIESALAEHPAIREAVVIAREDEPGNKRLAAYLVAQDLSTYDGGELFDYLKGVLPSYMMPAAFVLLDALPLTPNGKIDRRALPVPERAGHRREDAFVAPRSPVEEVLAEIWAEVLGVDRVGAHDNFFELGGHSLLATQIVSRVQETFQTGLPLRAVFEEPTVAALAAAMLDSGDRTRVERTAEMLLKIARLSDQEAAQLLEKKLYQVEGEVK
jgi:amino acid adenylation domain-containing protein